MNKFNIVELIENNPLTKLSNIYQSKILTKIKNIFDNEEQQMFVASFYCYLNYNNTDFIVDFVNVWKWLGFNKKDKAKKLLELYFKPDIEYKVLLLHKGEQKGRGGHNKETILLTIKTFKSLCLKACTKKADQIHEYYLKLENILQEVLNEETNELRIQLQEKDKQIQNVETDKRIIKENTILEHFPNNVQCIYYGIIDNTNSENETLIKFGCSNFLSNRIERHKKTYSNFYLLNAFRVDNKVLVENSMKHHSLLSKLRRTIRINNISHNELLAINNLSFEKLDIIIKDIITNMEYNPENYKKLLTEYEALSKTNTNLLNEIANMKNHIQPNETEIKQLNIQLLLLSEENQKLKNENIKLLKQCKNIQGTNIDDNNVLNSLKRITKSSDGLYHIGQSTYIHCYGSREQVWNDIAYKTAGGLTKMDLIVNKSGKIVSKKKFISEKTNNHLNKFNQSRK